MRKEMMDLIMRAFKTIIDQLKTGKFSHGDLETIKILSERIIQATENVQKKAQQSVAAHSG
jgi:hypothetical protein